MHAHELEDTPIHCPEPQTVCRYPSLGRILLQFPKISRVLQVTIQIHLCPLIHPPTRVHAGDKHNQSYHALTYSAINLISWIELVPHQSDTCTATLTHYFLNSTQS